MIGWIVFFIVFIGMMISLIFVVIKLKTTVTGGVPPNSKIYFFLGTQGTKGHALGVQVHSEVPQESSGEFKLVTCKPLDIPYNHKGKPIKRDNFEVGISKEFVIDIPSGENSLFRNMCLVFPRSPTELAKGIKNNILGSALIFSNATLALTDKAVKYMEEHECTVNQALNTIKKRGDELYLTYKREMENALKQNIKEKAAETKSKEN